MGYENVDPATLQTLIGSPPVATYDGAAVATGGILTSTNPSPPASKEPVAIYGAEDAKGPKPTWFAQLMGSFTENLATFDFAAALADIKEIQHHLDMGFDHWRRFVNGVVS